MHDAKAREFCFFYSLYIKFRKQVLEKNKKKKIKNNVLLVIRKKMQGSDTLDRRVRLANK